MKILIKVTKQILQRSAMCGLQGGAYGITKNCAFALAFRDIFPRAIVETSTSFIQGEYEGLEINNTHEMSEFIRLFDRSNKIEREAMEPQNFELEIPNEVIEYIGINQVYKILSESKTLELVKI